MPTSGADREAKLRRMGGGNRRGTGRCTSYRVLVERIGTYACSRQSVRIGEGMASSQ